MAVTKLKRAIIDTLSPEEMKAILGDIGSTVDKRNHLAMKEALLTLKEVTSELLFERLDEAWVKHVCVQVGLPAVGRRGALVRELLRSERGDLKERTRPRSQEPATGEAGDVAHQRPAPKRITADEQAMLALVPEDGGSIGNKSLREKLGWQERKYWRVRDGLIDKEILVVGAGRGGSVFRPVDNEPEEVKADAMVRSRAAPARVDEEDLYPGVCKMIEDNWLQLFPGFPKPAKLWVDSSPRMGSKRTGGKWTRPDVSAITLNRYKYIPGTYLDVFTFEVKPADQFNVLGIYEALAHSRRGNFSYVLYHLGSGDRSEINDELELIIREANRLRVGVATFDKADDADTWTVRAVPGRIETEPRFLNEFIGMLPEEIRDDIQLHVKS